MPGSETYTRSGKRIAVDLTQPLVLVVHNFSGDVSIRAVDRPDVYIEAHGPGRRHDLNAEPELKIEAQDNRIEVRPRQHCDFGWSGYTREFDLDAILGQISKAFRFAGPKFGEMAHNGFSVHGSPDMVIEVPRQMGGQIEVNSASGEVRVGDFSGEISLTTMSGDARAFRTRGRLNLQTMSGDLLVENASGRLSARTASGDVRITSSQLDGFEIQTANGDVSIDVLLTDTGANRVQTASGDVVLSLRRPAIAGADPAATLVFQTVTGDARVRPPFRRIDHGRWESGAGESGPRIEITTANGDLNATIGAVEQGFGAGPAPEPPAAETEWTIPPETPTPAAWDQEPDSDRARALAADFGSAAPRVDETGRSVRLAVLEAVERGEIDVEEALRRLEMDDAPDS